MVLTHYYPTTVAPFKPLKETESPGVDPIAKGLHGLSLASLAPVSPYAISKSSILSGALYAEQTVTSVAEPSDLPIGRTSILMGLH